MNGDLWETEEQEAEINGETDKTQPDSELQEWVQWENKKQIHPHCLLIVNIHESLQRSSWELSFLNVINIYSGPKKFEHLSHT